MQMRNLFIFAPLVRRLIFVCWLIVSVYASVYVLHVPFQFFFLLVFLLSVNYVLNDELQPDQDSSSASAESGLGLRSDRSPTKKGEREDEIIFVC